MPSARTAPKRAPERLDLIDLARGAAIFQMIAYHFIYDLNYFGWIHVRLTAEPGFIAWRSAIVSQFLFLVGIGAGLGHAAGRTSGRFWQRWAQIAGAAALVSAASAWLFGPRLIWFGILHFVAVALLLARPLPRLGTGNLALGAGALALGILVHDARFDPAALSWIGMVVNKPQTEDYVPLLPWFGVVAIGIGVAALWQRRDFRVPPALKQLPRMPARGLIALGRWPLTIYLIHQPLLMGALQLIKVASG